MRKIAAAVIVLVAASIFGTSARAADEGTISFLSKHTTLGVKIFSDLSYITNTSNGADVNPSGLGFDVKRGYLTLDTGFNDAWSIRFRTDFNYASAIGETNVYIKNLYAQRKFDNGIKLRIGVADMPWIPHMEDLYGYRYVEHVLIDYDKFGNSADWGLHLLGDEGRLNWQVSLVSGGGYKHPGRSKGLDLAGRLDFNAVGGLHLLLGGYTGKRGMDTEQAPSTHNASRYDAAVVYEGGGWNAGVDYFYANNWNNVTTTDSTSADGYSVFGSYNFTPAWGVFARYDYVKPCKDTTSTCSSDLKNTYYNAGVQFIASKQIRFAFVYKYNQVENGFWSTENGTIGGDPTTGSGVGKYQEIGFFMQASF